LSEPVRAEWASGRRKFSLALLLLWLGRFWLAVSVIVGLQIVAVPRVGTGLAQSAYLIPEWAVVSLGLAIALRRNPQNRALILSGSAWTLLGLAAVAWFVTSNV
jgi:hypothetical protein